MALYRITDEDLEGKGVIPLADIPGLPAEDMKAKFEQLVKDVIVPKYNETIDTLNALLYFDEHGNAYLTTQNLIVSYNALRHALDPEKVPNGISVRDMDVALRALITSLSNDVEALKGLGLDPKVAATVADMTDHDKIYVYVGSETGYVANDWYYWNGTAWTDGGVFNATALVTDTSLTQSGLAADAKVTGDKITATRVMIAPAYSISGVYAKDDIVTYGEKIYKAKQAISAEDWTAAHWQEINIGAFIPRLDTTLNTAGKAADAKATGDAIVGLDARITSNSGEIMSLKTRMLTAEADIDSLETRMTTAESDIDSLEGRMYTAESDIDSLEERMTTAELDITSLKSRVTLTEGEISAAEAMIAPDYSTSASYSKGDFVVYRNPASVYGKLYKAKQNISAESWNASHWDEVNIGASIPRIDTTLTQAGKAADAEAVGDIVSATNYIVQSNTQEINSLKTRVTTTERDILSLVNIVASAEGDIDGLETRMTTAESEIDTIQGQIGNNTLKTSVPQYNVDFQDHEYELSGTLAVLEDGMLGLTQKACPTPNSSDPSATDPAYIYRAKVKGWDTLTGRVSTAEENIISLGTRMTTAEGNISALDSLLDALGLSVVDGMVCQTYTE